jgi:hypothetical protein
MSTQLRCPVCSSESIYSLLNTLRCKRCGNIWKEEKKNKRISDTRRYDVLADNQKRLIKNKDTSETKMEKKLNDCLRKFKGKFSLDRMTWKIGDIQLAMFRSYLKKCVKNKTLTERKDDYGMIWYSRPD